MNEKPDANSFLERWSRKKRGLEADQPEPVAGDPTTSLAPNEPAEESGEAGPASGEASDAPKDFSDFDFEKLDYDSDYTQFMDKNVSSADRHKALRKLWVSNPVLANMDGLDDYCEDYTDAAVCLPKGMLKTAYQYGRGFLNDEEVAEWEALGADTKAGKPPPDAEPAAEETVTIAEASEAVPQDLDSGPGAGCAASVKQADEEMLAEFEAEEAEQDPKA
jgi:Protein of unknown function (DUF3306)